MQKLRFEHKYILQQEQSPNAHCQIKSYYKKASEYSSYNVKTLYFDTPSFDFLEMKRSGEVNKIKIRLRTYDEANFFLEIKIKEGERNRKIRHQLSNINNIEAVIRQTLMANSLSKYAAKTIIPTVLLEYRRDVYSVYSKSPDYRITFDSQIRSCRKSSISFDMSSSVNYPSDILEFKGHTRQDFFEVLVSSLHLKRESFSKYDWASSEYGL